jgi:tRNA(adenine34) deaminase
MIDDFNATQTSGTESDDEKFMKLALTEAKAAAEDGEIPVGAVVVARGRVIARAHNLTETLNDVTAHAEMQAITMAEESLGGKYLNDCTLYVTVEPCPMCAAALCWAQLGRLVYGASDPKRGYTLFSRNSAESTQPTAPGIDPATSLQPTAPGIDQPSAPQSAASQQPHSAPCSLLHPKTEVLSGVLADECGTLVSEFFSKLRK